jgi:uncharacterized repeat protein (TIGR03803 family)
MTGLQFRRLFAIACAGVIAGCSQSLGPSPFQAGPWRTASSIKAASVTYKDLYDFKAQDYPVGGLVYLNGKLYGVTDGGDGNCPETGKGCGTIFSVNLDGTNYKVLYTFTGRQDGGFPISLIAAKGNFYGSTIIGGAHGLGGLVFEATLSGKQRVLHEFGAANDGYYPGGLLYADGALYGITGDGGFHCKTCGTAFRMTLAGRETWIHTFGNGFDGIQPFGSLIDVDGTLYGTTSKGGPYTSGTVYKISEAGKERVLHGFGLYHDAITPISGLTVVNGTLYGEASGATGGICYCGAIFSIAPDGTNERVVYNFLGGDNGSRPSDGFVAVNATLYGTTPSGGPYYSSSDQGGTVFSFPISGSNDQILHNFGKPPDGYSPQGPLLYVNGSFYGITQYGGKNKGGMLFSFSGAP